MRAAISGCTFFIPLKVTLMTGFLIALPVVLYQMWAFVAPGLYAKEKKVVVPFVFFASLFFPPGTQPRDRFAAVPNPSGRP